MERLTVLLGSGSTIPLGMPSVRDLSVAVENLGAPTVKTSIGSDSNPIPATKILHRALRSEYGETNFELALHAVETLLSYAAVDTFDVDLSDVHQVLRAFTDPAPRWSSLLHFDTLESLRLKMIKVIVENIAGAESRPDSSALKSSSRFINMLHDNFALRCFTLNYDSTIDTQLNWNDGFADSLPTPFSRKRFYDKLRVSEPMLMHLHGSVKFGYTDKGFIAKFATISEAMSSYGKERFHKPNAAGELNAPGTVISGLRKTDKLNSTPYGYYYSAFVNSIVENPHLIIVGYGFHDTHLDYWIGQHRTIHGASRRVVLITRDSTLATLIEDNPKKRIENYKSGAHILWRKGNKYSIDWEKAKSLAYFKDPELMVVLSGFPVTSGGLQVIREHLSR